MFRFFAYSTIAFVFMGSFLDAKQVDNPILERVRADSAAVLIIDQPVQLLDHFKYLDAAENTYLKRAVHAAGCGNNPILSTAQATELALLYDDFYDVLREIDEAVLVIHKWNPGKTPEVTAIFRTKQGIERLESLWRRAGDAIAGVNEQDEQSAITQEPRSNQRLAASVRGFKSSTNDEVFAISNSSENIAEQLTAQTNQGNKLTYSSSRRFKRINSHFSDFDLDGPILFGLGNPSKLRALFPTISEKHWSALGVDMLPSFGCALFLKKSKQSGQSANIVGEVYFTLTQPKSRISRFISAYQPLELVDAGFEPTFFKAEAFDPVERNLSEKEVFSVEFPDERFEDSKKIKNKRDSRSYFNDLLPRTDATYYFEKKLQDSLQNELLVVEKIRDKDAMDRSVLGLISILNNLHSDKSEHILPAPNEFGRLFAVQPKSDKKGGLDGPSSQGYFLNDNWFASGNIELVEQFAQNDDDPALNFGNISELVKRLDEDIDIAGEMVKVDFYTPSYFEQRASTIEGNRITEKYRGQKIDTSEIFNREADEFGNTIKIESEADSMAMLCRHLLEFVAEKYGNQIVVASRDNDRFQLRIGIFPRLENQK